MKFNALIPFKSKSTRFSDKNFSRFGDSSLLDNLVAKLVKITEISNIYISTDAPDRVVNHTTYQKQHFDKLYDRVHVIRRPFSLAQDDTSTDDVVRHFVNFECRDGCDVVVVCQVSSPVWRPVSLSRALYVFESGSYDSVVSVSPDFEPNGCFYIVRSKDFKSIYNENMFLVVLDWDESVDIDYRYQLMIAEAVGKKRFLE